MDYKELQSYMELSPFEVQFALTNIAGNFRDHTLLNAGRGNPNWIATTPRQAFFTLGNFAVEESKCNCEYIHTGFHPEKTGIAERFKEYVLKNPDEPGIKFLKNAVDYGIDILGFTPDSWVYELVTGVIGDFYPEPDRMLPHAEKVVHSFLIEFLCNNEKKECKYDLFATEGGTGGIIYVFNSLMENKLISKGDKIAIGSPIFTPYLEIPRLNDYELVEVEIEADADDDWQYPDSEIDKVLAMAAKIPARPAGRNAIVFLDLQVGFSNVQTELPLLSKYLKLPNVHLGIDPEFSMKTGIRPGKVVGTLDATDINFAANYLAEIVRENNLPPKILVIHRYTEKMVTNYQEIKPLPEVQIVMNMDGWGGAAKKIGTYTHFIYPEPVQFTGFKLFYKNGVLSPGTDIMTPESLLKLNPQPIYIQYQ